MLDLLRNLKETEYQGVKELADAAEGVLREAGPSYRKGTVAEYPNERTVRYYISSGLLTSASEKRGLRSVFGYEHLLKLLTIKKLQSDGLPINLIKELISDKTIEDLEKLLGEEVRVFTEREAMETFRQANQPADPRVEEFIVGAEVTPEAPPPKSKAREYLESLLLTPKPPAESEPQILYSRAPERPKVDLAMSRPMHVAPKAESWKKYEIAPGLELHARDDFRTPRDTTRLMRLFERILRQFDSK
jgi:DNA-binding transcriptional MerR regulator